MRSNTCVCKLTFQIMFFHTLQQLDLSLTDIINVSLKNDLELVCWFFLLMLLVKVS